MNPGPQVPILGTKVGNPVVPNPRLLLSRAVADRAMPLEKRSNRALEFVRRRQRTNAGSEQAEQARDQDPVVSFHVSKGRALLLVAIFLTGSSKLIYL